LPRVKEGKTRLDERGKKNKRGIESGSKRADPQDTKNVDFLFQKYEITPKRLHQKNVIVVDRKHTHRGLVLVAILRPRLRETYSDPGEKGVRDRRGSKSRAESIRRQALAAREKRNPAMSGLDIRGLLRRLVFLTPEDSASNTFRGPSTTHFFQPKYIA